MFSLPECCHRAWLSSGWNQAGVLSWRNHIHTDNLPACTKREIGGVLLILSEKALFRQLSWTQTGALLELRVKETGLHPYLRAGPEGECSSHGSWFPWCQFPLFSPFPVGLAARLHIYLCCSLSYRSGRFLQGQEFTVPGVSWASVICFLDKHSTTEPHTPSPDLLCMLRPGGESHGWHFRRVSCMLCNQSQTVIPKTLGVD